MTRKFFRVTPMCILMTISTFFFAATGSANLIWEWELSGYELFTAGTITTDGNSFTLGSTYNVIDFEGSGDDYFGTGFGPWAPLTAGTIQYHDEFGTLLGLPVQALFWTDGMHEFYITAPWQGSYLHNIGAPWPDGYWEGQAVILPSQVVPDPIPEPASMLLLGTGLISLSGVRRKFKKG